ncbi:hypothetical protein GLOTRDRAFT_136553 [Gloeophyllum trabeum ATCC 11539]|uniref:Uncharacterized protein n=1 Tax=Gloeophyllum trabeum (strain ATCC 11539 / FP-39264 / Madison 617) TaxID=670483 RepID=S7RXV0_GLOTA|nr:uncharacterized protein GLOTRDRAFT_136553 [Gloeophyllum trabeum ATCC 11539]EPQ59765.1 hypothetical protein GLOTRDRAFT_136553 [Gloeophyllum trabeum ATCC 11539]
MQTDKPNLFHVHRKVLSGVDDLTVHSAELAIPRAHAVSISADRADVLLQHLPAVCADASRALSAQHVLHPVVLAVNSGQLRTYDILGELSPRSAALLALPSAPQPARATHTPANAHVHYRLPPHRVLSLLADIEDSFNDAARIAVQVLECLEVLRHVDTANSRLDFSNMHGGVDLNTMLGARGDGGLAGFLLDYEHATEYRLRALPLVDVRKSHQQSRISPSVRYGRVRSHGAKEMDPHFPETAVSGYDLVESRSPS